MKKLPKKKYYFASIIIYFICCILWAINAVIQYNNGHIVTFVLSIICCVSFGIAGVLYACLYQKNRQNNQD